MNDRELIERLCALLSEAVDIVRVQSELLAMHDIYACDLPDQRERLLSEVDEII